MPIPWDKEIRFRIPVKVWKDLMDTYYPGIAWLCLERDAFDRLYRYKVERGIPTWEQALESSAADRGRGSEVMNTAAADRIARAVLYEGYMLYPYRPSAVKNQQRFNFGVVYPHAFSETQKGADPWTMHTECLVQGGRTAQLQAQVRFLQLMERSVQATSESSFESHASSEFHPVKALAVDGQMFYSWQEAVEREINVPATDLQTLNRYSLQRPFHLIPSTSEEDLRDRSGRLLGRILRTQYPVDGFIEVLVQEVAEEVFKIASKREKYHSVCRGHGHRPGACADAFAGLRPHRAWH